MYTYIFVDLVKHGVLTLVGEISHCVTALIVIITITIFSGHLSRTERSQFLKV